MSIAAIADELHLHPNTVRFHLDRLVNAGQVEQVAADHKRPGRPPLMFRATARMDRDGPRSYQVLAEILSLAFAAESDPGTKALAAGRAWGRQLQSPTGKVGVKKSVEHLLEVLDELGFAPERRGQHRVGLRHCPFLELAEARTAVVCPIHLGLMQGALEAWNAPVTVDRLDAFAEPDLCLAHLTRTDTVT
ncbi:transcriptional regulator [Mycobacterium shimoidei]|nr:transcriptional regulator [Mycobacterium shimoidei]